MSTVLLSKVLVSIVLVYTVYIVLQGPTLYTKMTTQECSDLGGDKIKSSVATSYPALRLLSSSVE